jgi:hypothetical protein
MKKNLRMVKTSLIIGILLLCAIIPFITIHDTTASAAKLISFNSYIDLQYNLSALDKPLQIDVAVSIPITVKFWTDIPDVFSKIPFPFNNIILYGKPIGPEMKIHLEILNAPEWANIYLSSPDVLTNIPIKKDGAVYLQTDLIISPKVEAPAEPQRIDIRVSTETIKRLSNISIEKSIPFTPSFIPTIGIDAENPIRTVGPHESVAFRITIKNSGNKITRVTPKIVGTEDKWTATINPPEAEIQPNQESTFTFSIITPYDFGWHNEYGRFEIDFQSEVYPFIAGSPTHNQSIYLVVNNHGFSTPGFEFVVLIGAILVIITLMRKKHIKN